MKNFNFITPDAHISNTKGVYIFYIEFEEGINERGKEF